ncbi:MAG: TraR/DksA C4-type zinc finger protein [candidate division WOR-3 bacterium]|nr:TraR/DksA C4-type zinc finger protein [candidate division WOR-3 bacterium]
MIKNRKELLEFEKRLLQAKKHLLKQRKWTDSILFNTQTGTPGQDSTYRTHIADISSDTYQKEFTSQLTTYEGKILMEIEQALSRIRENRYGDCEKCGKPIAKARLKALPYTRFCIKCQKSLGDKTS